MNNEHIFIAVIAGLVNLLLSVLVPCAIKKGEQPIVSQVRQMFNQNREMLLASSALTAVIVFIALSIAPIARTELPEGLVNLASLKF
jgi:hypothetical protein